MMRQTLSALFVVAVLALAVWVAYTYAECLRRGGEPAQGLFGAVCVVR